MPTKKKTSKKTATKRAGPKTTASKKLASSPRAKNKVRKVMHEYKEGELHSGSKKGPKVKSRKQAIAIALSEAGASNQKSSKKKTAKKRAR
jgi:hypothetical protein